MPIEILMPALSPTMTEGNVSKWMKKEGDKVSPGDVLAEIETDKATMEVEAVDSGIMGKILVADGTEGVAVNQLIALLLEEGEDKAVLADYKTIGAEGGKTGAAAAGSDEAVTPAQISAPVVAIASGGRVAASPLARRIAANEDVDLAALTGTGPHGRIIRADVLEAKSAGAGAGAKKTAPLAAVASVGRNATDVTKIPNNMMRKVIAKRLTESKQTVPHFYLNVECELDKLLAMRSDMNNAAGKDNPAYKLSVNDFIIKAVAMALRAVPAANASWTDEAILQYNNVDISVAVAIDGGLITPIVKNADQKSLSVISNEMKDLAGRAKAGKLAPEEFQGGGFSISNLGMFGIKNFNAIVNPPQGCILAIGAGTERAVVHKGQLVAATVMDATLSCDHRVVDGAVGAEFLAAFKKFVENPVTMLV